MKLTEEQKCVLHLAERGGWVRVCEIGGKFVRGQIIGSQADRRLLDVLDDVKKFGFVEVEGNRYVVEASKEGKYKTYRIASSVPKPKQQVVQLFTPEGRPYVKVQMV